MKQLFLIALLSSSIATCQERDVDLFSKKQVIISEDITHFWEAYDAIQTTSDTLQQMQYLQNLFLEKATLGQQRMMEARNYTPQEYLVSIRERPLFWNSIRANTGDIERFNKQLLAGVDKLAKIYPTLTMSTIYYTIGNFRSPGTGVDNMVLIGTEYALGDTLANTSELPEHVQNYYKINPVDRLEFLTVHEYIHTQQKGMVHNLLSLTLYEGIAEFMAIEATKQKSPWRAFEVGSNNADRVRQRFEEDMFRPNTIYNWLWNSSNNEFQASDMSYYVGSTIAAKYYSQETDKKQAVKQLIELDYTDEDKVEELVDQTNYFSSTLESMYSQFESNRPTVVSLDIDKNGDRVPAGKQVVTVHFSQPMSKESTGFDYGPLGEKHVLRVERVIGFSEDGKSFTFEVNVDRNQHYQCTMTTNFRSESGYRLKPYLIEFKTR